MRANAVAFVIPALFATVALGQPAAEENVDRVLPFTHAQTSQQFQEIATVIRALIEITQISVDIDQKAVALHGTAAQIAMADWLFHQLDVAGQPPQAKHEYVLPGGGDDVTRVFYTNTATVQQLQEVATLIRSMTEVRRLFTYNAAKAITLRGTASQIALADWLLNQLDRPASGQAAQPYRLGTDDVVRVFFLHQTRTVQDLQEVATLVRAITETRRLFTYNAPRAVTVRGTAAQIALATWLFGQMDQPATVDKAQVNEYRLPDDDDVTRVFYLAHAQTPRELQDIAVEVRSTTKVRRLFTYNAPRAIALRGTAAQIALADQLIKERGQ